MSSDPLRLIDAFRNLKILVIGEAMLDSYLDGSTGRLCREAPVPIVDLSSRADLPGGAANAAVNAAMLGGRVSFVSVIGGDAEGAVVRRALEERGVQIEHLLIDEERRTLAKSRISAAGQLLVRFDQGDTGAVARRSERVMIDRLTALYPYTDAVIVSDYDYGILAPRVIAALTALQRRFPRLLVVDSKRPSAYRGVDATAVKPNYDEAVQLLQLPRLEDSRMRAEQIESQGEQVLDLTGAQLAAVTLDTEGAVLIERGRPHYRTYARPVRNSRCAGAGDTFTSTLALALAAGASTPAAAELASAAAAVVVAKDGTATCSAEELRERTSTSKKVVHSLERLRARVELHRREGRTIVFTNGCFDILHRGHITYLNRAKALGDLLIVGVNSDASVARLKGESRPINPLEDRMQVLDALSCVDHIVPFSEDTPAEIIRAIRPDIFVKGGDYMRETLPEAPLVEQLGGTVRILPYLEDRSTSGIIQRIRQADARADAPSREQV